MSSPNDDSITKYGKSNRSNSGLKNVGDYRRRKRKSFIKKTVRKQRDFKQYFFVIRELTKREIKRKYARSVLGILWSVLSPLLFMIIMSLIFSTMFRKNIENFPVYYIIGQTIWTLFSTATNTSMSAIVDNKSLLIKSKLPKQTFIISRVYTALVNFLYTCIALVAVMLFFRIQPTVYTLLFPVPVVLCLIFSLGISYILSTIYVYFGDVKHLYSVFLTMLMFLSAIFYPLESLSGLMQRVVGNNPVYIFVHCARDCLLNGVLSDGSVWIKMIIWSFAMLIIGIIVYKRKENDIMQRL